ncbi:MAG: amidohydrolase family protein [Myxococcota bacterium]
MAHRVSHGYVVRGGGEFLVWAAGDFENFLADKPDITTRKEWRAQLMAVTRHLLARQWPLRIHATYDESFNHILDVFEEADALEKAAGRRGFDGIRFCIDHAETATAPTIQRVHRLRGGIATQSRMAYAGEYFLERYGREAAERAPAFGDMLEAGIPVGLGSDATRVSSYNPWVSLYWAVTGKTVGGTSLLSAKHRLSRAKALELHTVGSAWFSQEEDIKGRITPGQLADLSVLSEDYFQVAPERIRSIESVLTVTGGRVVYGAGPFAERNLALPPLEPSWSPVNRFGGYQTAALAEGGR